MEEIRGSQFGPLILRLPAVHKIKESKENLERFWTKRSKYYGRKEMKTQGTRITIIQGTVLGFATREL